MGNIQITHLDSTVENCSLVTGYNIRDWVSLSNTVNNTTSPNVSNAWTGLSQPYYPGPTGYAPWGVNQAVIDMLSVPVEGTSPITSIVISDNSVQLLNNPSPGLFVYGVTLETVPEPSSVIALLCGVGGIGGMILKRKSA